ncbi:MAG: hypothetical protein P8M78_16975 [Myxococcota bacterium]|nr:hypothetical protein [Myxococcota bacterium]
MKKRLRSSFLAAVLITGLFGATAHAQPASQDFWNFLTKLIAYVTALNFDAYEWDEINPSAAWSPRAGLESVELDGLFYVIAGRTPLPPPAPPFASIINRDVWVSEDDGDSWKFLGDAPWPERAFFEAVVKDGYMYVMGGQSFELVCPFPGCQPGQEIPISTFYNDVYRSRDGIEWETMTEAAPWGPRAGLSAVVHKGWLYVFGGAIGDDPAIGGAGRTFYTDVYKSRDGSDWIEVTDSVPWSGRGGAAAVSFKGRIYLMGGEDGFLDPPFGDVWVSKNGAHWKRLRRRAWKPRSGHKCGVLERNIVCFGGFNLTGNPMDVQISRDGRRWTALDPAGPAAPPWQAEIPTDIKYDFDIITIDDRDSERRGIYTFGGDRETFEFPTGPPPGFDSDDETFPGEVPIPPAVDNDVWRFSPGPWKPHGD